MYKRQVAVNALLGAEVSKETLVQCALEGERLGAGSSHADNIAPCICGGFVLVPAMLYILGMSASVVVGTSLFQILFVTMATTMMHALTTKAVDSVLAVLLLVGSVTGAQVGTSAVEEGSRVVDHARRRSAAKRGGKREREPIESISPVRADPDLEVPTLADEIRLLATENPARARPVARLAPSRFPTDQMGGAVHHQQLGGSDAPEGGVYPPHLAV